MLSLGSFRQVERFVVHTKRVLSRYADTRCSEIDAFICSLVPNIKNMKFYYLLSMVRSSLVLM